MEIFCWPLHKSEKNAQSVEIFMNNEKSMDGRKNADREHLIEREKNAESHGCSVCHHSVSIHETNTQSRKVLDH